MKRIFAAMMIASATLSAQMPSKASAGSTRELMGPVLTSPTPAQLIERCDFYLGIVDERRESLVSPNAEQSSNDPLRLYDDIDGMLGAAGGEFVLYREVLLTAELRDTAAQCENRISEKWSEISLSRPVYERLAAIDAKGADPATRKYLAETLADFERSGVALAEDKRARVQAIRIELDEVSTEIARNIAQDIRSIEVTPEDLAGLPDDFIASREVKADGTITLTTAYTDYQPVMSYAESDELRRRYSQTYLQRAWPKNDALLKRMFTLRAELAALLGRENYAALALENKMLDTPAKVTELMASIEAVSRPIAKAEYSRMLGVLEQLRPGAERIEPWQSGWLSDKTQEALFQYNSQEARRYFAYDNVRDGVFALVERMFGVEIRDCDTPVWHEDVGAHEIVEGDKVIGRFYLDSHPRPGKYTHANNVSLYPGDQNEPPVTAVVQNLPKGDHSTGLMEHSQVETFLHEFGHALHAMFGSSHIWFGQRYNRVEWDFIEAPSQMLENWVYDYDTLATFAVDKNGNTIPRDLVEKMNRVRYFNRGMQEMSQLGLAATSLNFHTQKVPDNLGEAMRSWQSAYSIIPPPEFSEMQAAFNHLDGYSAYYYTYAWSRVIAADLYAKFVADGLNDPAVAGAYRREVLEPGATRPASEMVTKFLGRDVTFDAFAEEVAKSIE